MASEAESDQEDLLPGVPPRRLAAQKTESTKEFINQIIPPKPKGGTKQVNNLSLKAYDKQCKENPTAIQSFRMVRKGEEIRRPKPVAAEASTSLPASPPPPAKHMSWMHQELMKREKEKASSEPSTSPSQRPSSPVFTDQDRQDIKENSQDRFSSPDSTEETVADRDVIEQLSKLAMESCDSPDSQSSEQTASSAGQMSSVDGGSYKPVVSKPEKSSFSPLKFMLALRQKVTIFFHNLSPDVVAADIEALVEDYGTFFNCHILMNVDEKGREVPTGYAVIDVLSLEVAERIIRNVHQKTMLFGRPVSVGMERNSLTEQLSSSPVEPISPPRTTAAASKSPVSEQLVDKSPTSPQKSPSQRCSPKAPAASTTHSEVSRPVLKSSDATNRPPAKALEVPAMKPERQKIVLVSRNEVRKRYELIDKPSHSEMNQQMDSFFGGNVAGTERLPFRSHSEMNL